MKDSQIISFNKTHEYSISETINEVKDDSGNLLRALYKGYDLDFGRSVAIKKSRIIATVMSGAETSSQGRALPCRECVLSMIWPIRRFVMASMILEMIGKSVRKAATQGNALVRSSTSV